MRFFEGCTALVTGASSGLGSEFARQLAPLASCIVLVARRNDRLEELAASLHKLHPHLDLRIFATDLSIYDQRCALVDWLADEQIHVDFLVNNAGLGDHGDFASSDWNRIQSMLDVNIHSVTHLTHSLIGGMIVKGRAAILNVSSVAGFFPIPHMAVYAATKAYVTSFSEALGIELRPLGITVTALCPGPVPTEFFETASRPGDEDHKNHFRPPPAFSVSAAEAVKTGLLAVANDRRRVVPNHLLALTTALALVLPFFLLRRILTAKSASF